jgi:hypothetical protein
MRGREKLGTVIVKGKQAMFLAHRKNEKMETMIEQTLEVRRDKFIEWMIRELKAELETK